MYVLMASLGDGIASINVSSRKTIELKLSQLNLNFTYIICHRPVIIECSDVL